MKIQTAEQESDAPSCLVKAPDLAFWAVAIGVVTVSLGIRWSLRHEATYDYNAFYSKWVEYIRSHAKWQSLKTEIGDPGPFYFTLVCLVSWLPVPKLYVTKIIGTPFDYLIAFLVFQIVGRRWGSARMGALAGIGCLFLPTVVINSALWGQSDAIYTSALIGTLYAMLEQKNKLALAAYGVAVACKPQACILMPLIVGLLWRRQLPWRATWISAGSYLACGLPAVLAGRPILHVVFHWLRQHNVPLLTIAAPNWYQWLPEWIENNRSAHQFYMKMGMVVSGLTIVALTWAIATRPIGEDRQKWLVTAALLCALVLPFVMPGMHERYFFTGDVLALIYAWYVPRRWWVPLLVQAASFGACCGYLHKNLNVPEVPQGILALLMGIALVAVWMDFVGLTQRESNTIPVFAGVRVS